VRVRKKVVEVDAVRFEPGNEAAILKFAGDAVADKVLLEGKLVGLSIKTLRGAVDVCLGDWVVCGVKGEYYPCRDDIFRATYEPVVVSARFCGTCAHWKDGICEAPLPVWIWEQECGLDEVRRTADDVATHCEAYRLRGGT